MDESAALESGLLVVDSMLTTAPTSGSGLTIESGAIKSADTTSMTQKVLSGHQELDCRTFTFVVYVVLFGLMVAFGLVGNTLSFIVLQFDRHSHAATFLLQVTNDATIHNIGVQIYNTSGQRASLRFRSGTVATLAVRLIFAIVLACGLNFRLFGPQLGLRSRYAALQYSTALQRSCQL